MATSTAREGRAGPILIEIGPEAWKGHLDRVEGWLRHVVAAQAEFRTLAADTAAKVREPHWREYLEKVAEAASEHQAKAEEMFRVIGRDPSRSGRLSGAAAAKAREGLAAVV